MNSPSEDVKDILVDSSFGAGSFAATTGWAIFVSDMPDDENTPDTCIGIFDTSGNPPNPNFSYERPSIQVRVRGAKAGYQDAYDKAKDIMDGLNGKTNEEWNSTRYIQITSSSDILWLGYDEKRRPLFTMNFNIHRTDAT
jgi:hypothetical protein